MVSCLGLLVQCAVGREGNCKQILLVCGGSTHSFPDTLGLPSLMECVLYLSTLLRLQVALQGVGPELHAPKPKPFWFRFRFLGIPQRCRFGWACVLFLPGPSTSGNQELEDCTLPRCSMTSPLPIPASVSRRPSRVCLVSLLGS